MADVGVKAVDVLKHTRGFIQPSCGDQNQLCFTGSQTVSIRNRSNRKKYFKPNGASKVLFVPKPKRSVSTVLANMYSGDWVGFLSFFSTSLGINSHAYSYRGAFSAVKSVQTTIGGLFHVWVFVLLNPIGDGIHSHLFFCTFFPLLPSVPIVSPSLLSSKCFLHHLFIPSIQGLFPVRPPVSHHHYPPVCLCVYRGDICSLPRLLAACSSALWSACCLTQNGAIH